MKAGEYRPRLADAELRQRLEAAGAVVVEGPKACGKTETARQVAASEVLLDTDVRSREAAAVDPSLILPGDVPRLIDEWQVEPGIWNHVRRAVDDRREPGQFILAGSAVPADDETRHSGAGRFSRLRMRPMSSFESGVSGGAISLRSLFAGERGQAGDTGMTIGALAEEIARGGWPGLRDGPLDVALQGVVDYLEEVRRTDIRAVDGVGRDPERLRRLLRSLARNVSTSAALTTLARDTAGAGPPLDERTVGDYMRALGRLFVVEEQPAWEPHLRSRVNLRRSPKRHFVDPSLAVAALEADPEALVRDLNLLGLLFESLVIRDLRIYSQTGGWRVRHYRDNKGLEVDAIVEGRGGWGAFEVKLGGERAIESAAKSLLQFSRRIDSDKVGEPAVLGIVVATGYGYVREDGIQVIPIGALGP
jgi:uncharacterized protein